jgi:hypothetical protein
MKWVVLAIGIAVAMTVAILGVGMVGMTHYCMPLATHGFTPMICKIPLPPIPLKPLPIPHPNYH